MFVNMVLEDVTEYEITPEGKKVGAAVLFRAFLHCRACDVWPGCSCRCFAALLLPAWSGSSSPAACVLSWRLLRSLCPQRC